LSIQCNFCLIEDDCLFYLFQIIQTMQTRNVKEVSKAKATQSNILVKLCFMKIIFSGSEILLGYRLIDYLLITFFIW